MKAKSICILASIVVVLAVCVIAFGGWFHEKSTEELIEDLKSSGGHERLNAVRTLPRRTGDAEQVIPALIAALKDKDDHVRRSAAIALGEYREKARDAIPALQELAHRDRDGRIRNSALGALAKIDPSAIPKSDEPAK